MKMSIRLLFMRIRFYSIYLMGMEKQMLIIIWGIYMVDLEQYDSARHYLEKSLFLSPSRSIPYWSLAVMEAELGNFKSAITIWIRLLWFRTH